jgi:hypothetical protein
VCWNCKVLCGNHPIATRIREKGLRKTLRDKVVSWRELWPWNIPWHCRLGSLVKMPWLLVRGRGCLWGIWELRQRYLGCECEVGGCLWGIWELCWRPREAHKGSLDWAAALQKLLTWVEASTSEEALKVELLVCEAIVFVVRYRLRSALVLEACSLCALRFRLPTLLVLFFKIHACKSGIWGGERWLN